MSRRSASCLLVALVVLLGLLAPFGASAQQTGQMRRIGVLMGLPEDPRSEARLAAFRKGLQTLGWEEGRNIRLDGRWATTSDAPLTHSLAKELVALHPDVLWSHNTPTTAALLQHTRAATPVHNSSELEPIIAAQARIPNGGLAVMTDAFLLTHRTEIATLAARYRLPTVYPFRDFIEAGGLLSYGNDPRESFHRAAKALGLTIPRSLLLRAEEVIE